MWKFIFCTDAESDDRDSSESIGPPPFYAPIYCAENEDDPNCKIVRIYVYVKIEFSCIVARIHCVLHESMRTKKVSVKSFSKGIAAHIPCSGELLRLRDSFIKGNPTAYSLTQHAMFKQKGNRQ